ncbi:MAG TPA: DUF5317 family protein [Coriobacteriia bacterium]|nr:DUF5317 family protein [Coriobacteriia bacterium]
MLALSAIVLALVLGPVAGGRIDRLLVGEFPHQTVILVLFVLQAVARGQLVGMAPTIGLVSWGLVSLVLLLLLLPQAKVPGLGVAAAGIASNALVVLLNMGMPVDGSGYFTPTALRGAIAASNGFYHPVTAATHVVWLGDVLPMAGGLASLGDLLLAVGVAVFLLDIMLRQTTAG